VSINRITIMGNIGSDPDLKSSTTDMVCTFSVATNEYYTSELETKKHTEWHSVVVFAKLAQNCSLYLRKGSRVFLEGRLRTSSYQDKEGRQQTKTRIYASTVQFLDAKTSDVSHSLVVEGQTTLSDYQSSENELA
jgi:single-strand DNA-binding protein